MSRDESFRAALRESGIEYSGELYFDSRLHRFKAEGDNARNSWFVLYDGSIAAGAFGCWKRGIKETWCERNGSLTQAEWQNVRQRWREAKAKLAAETVARQKKARKVAVWILNRSRPARTLHRYLFGKRVKVFGNVRQYRRSLVLPLHDFSGELQSLQFIGGDGVKKFLSGERVAGCFFTLADKTDEALVICEGYATGASIYEAISPAVFCAMNSGNLLEVAKAARERWPQREIIIAADDDQFTDGNPGLTKATAAAKAIRAKLAVPLFNDVASKPTDFNDLAIEEGLDAVREQVDSAKVPKEIEAGAQPKESDDGASDEETFARLASLSPADYDRRRKDEAKRLGLRPPTLDAQVSARRTPHERGAQGSAVEFPNVEPWPEPVNGADVLNETAATFSRYLVLPSGAADALALRTAHTHAFEAFMHTPRLNFCSPEKGCGKTTALDVTASLVPRALRAENITAAVLFRLVDSCKPTLLLDEVDNYLPNAEELCGLLNAGHKRGAKAYRCEGKNNIVRGFAAFAPAALAGIGALPGTLHDRSIVVRLVRAKSGEIVARFDSRRVQRETELCRKLARLALDNFDRLKEGDPQLPDTAFNRLADNWRPLFAIAEIAGGDWPKRASEAFTKLTSTEDLDAQSVGTLLLADIAATFTAKNTDKIFSAQLCEELVAIEGRPWAEWGRPRKPISVNQLATQLRRFSVSPHEIRISDETGRGYELADFEDAFSRYLADTPLSDRNSETLRGKTAISEVKHTQTVFHPENELLQRECFSVSLQKGDTSENADSGERDIEAVSADVDASLPNQERSAGKEKLRL